MRLMLLVGAGASIELGVPGMKGLAADFRAHVQQWRIHPQLVSQLIGESDDVEVLIERVDQLSAARVTLEQLGHDNSIVDAVDVVRAELEWFVQHTAERVVPAEAQVLWGAVLRESRRHDVVFATTNYDRAIELAANAGQIELNDGFQSVASQEVARWQGFKERLATTPLLLKLHGSTDWYSDRRSGEPVKLRHPMPLFGRAALSLPDGLELGSSLVLPSREKILNRSPFPRLSQTFLDAIDQCDTVIVVGSSLRDNHLRDAVHSVSNPRCVYVVNPVGDLLSLANARAIGECASQFLVSTLPAALGSSAPTDILDAASGTTRQVGPILPWLKVALDGADIQARRCEAIERLAAQEVGLPESHVLSLLGDADPTVARYALGLIRDPSREPRLMQYAEQCTHVADAMFLEELALLKRLASR